ncbi:MAG: hypothetical protein A2W80_06880 [Candidatus Riflebacteria bacterium GWC2_50_8]|nr:MAG: hypothetical protein A2W80_06880 [Candidatus Riflebacteria bacterium GWC2_50_8]
MFTMGEDMMKQWATNWEKMMGDHLEKLVHNEKFISEMSKSIAATMTGKAFYSKALDEQMAAMNLPSRTEIIKIMQKLTDIEERLIDLSERFEDYADAQQAKPAAKAAPAAEKPEPAAAQAHEGKAKKHKK